MMVDWLSWVLGIVGILGIGGAFALFFLAPTLFQVILEGAQQMFAAIVATRLGCALLAAVLTFVATDQYREHAAAAQCSSVMVDREKKADRLAQQRDVTQSATADTDAKSRVAELEQQSSHDQETINALRQADQACHPITVDQLR